MYWELIVLYVNFLPIRLKPQRHQMQPTGDKRGDNANS